MNTQAVLTSAELAVAVGIKVKTVQNQLTSHLAKRYVEGQDVYDLLQGTTRFTFAVENGNDLLNHKTKVRYLWTKEGAQKLIQYLKITVDQSILDAAYSLQKQTIEQRQKVLELTEDSIEMQRDLRDLLQQHYHNLQEEKMFYQHRIQEDQKGLDHVRQQSQEILNQIKALNISIESNIKQILTLR